MNRRWVLLAAAALAVSGCGAPEPVTDAAALRQAPPATPVAPPVSALPPAVAATPVTPAPAAPTAPPAPTAEPAPTPDAPSEPPGGATGGATDVAGVADRLFVLANEARAAAGVARLARHGGLDEVALGWSRRLADAGAELSHNPSYSSQIPSGWSAAAENVAVIDDDGHLSATEVADRIHRAWMDSEGHRVNLLNPAYTHLGVGVAHHRVHGYYLTQNFAAY